MALDLLIISPELTITSISAMIVFILCNWLAPRFIDYLPWTHHYLDDQLWLYSIFVIGWPLDLLIISPELIITSMIISPELTITAMISYDCIQSL
jgi:hypothetical protein